MPDHVYEKKEVVGSSTDSIADAVKNAIQSTASTVQNPEWFEVTEIRGHIEGNQVGHFQVTVKIGYRPE